MKLVYKCLNCGLANASEYVGIHTNPKDVLGTAFDLAEISPAMIDGCPPYKPHTCGPGACGVAMLVGLLEH